MHFWQPVLLRVYRGGAGPPQFSPGPPQHSPGPPQLYTLDHKQTQYAINERPTGEVPLGYVAVADGELTIKAMRMDQPVMLRDTKLQITHDLSLGDYTFNPANPQEPTMPNTYRLYLDTDAEGACTFNIASGQKQKAGQYVRVTAQNITPGFVFKGWFVDGQKVSSSMSFNYLMPYSDVTLLASLVYDPANPGDPDSDNEQESIDNGRPGDVNNDGKVNVTDIMAVANHILNIHMDKFNLLAADVNGDGDINVTDIMGIANIILKVGVQNSRVTSEVDAVEPQ